MKKIILLLTICVLLFNLVGAIPPFQTGSTTLEQGLVIESPIYDVLKTNEKFTYNFHVFNQTSGLLMDNTTTDCYFHLYNADGSVNFSIDNIKMNGDKHTFQIEILSSNFTDHSKGGFLTHCNTSDVGGFVSGGFMITTTGFPLTIAKTLLCLGLFGIFIFLFIVNVGVIPFLPKGDNKDDEGELISINHLKYIRPILYVTAYLMIVVILFTSANLSLAYLESTLVGNLLFKMFYITFALAIPMVIIWFIFIFYSIFQDKKMKEYIERGVINDRSI